MGSTRDGVFIPGAIPESEYRIVTKERRVFHSLHHLVEVSDNRGFQVFDVFLTADELDHCLLGAPPNSAS